MSNPIHRLALLVVLGLTAAVSTAAEPVRFEPSRHSQAVTACDRAAAHGDDPFRVAPGRERVDMDLPRAIATCEVDLKLDPGNPRLQYQLGRALTYSGRVKEGLPLLEQSAAAGYPQSQFVAGILYLRGDYDAPRNPCRGGELIRDSAISGRFAGQVGFPAWVLEGRFKDCPVRQDTAEMIGFLEAAKAAKLDFYRGLLVDVLLRELRTSVAAPSAK